MSAFLLVQEYDPGFFEELVAHATQMIEAEIDSPVSFRTWVREEHEARLDVFLCEQGENGLSANGYLDLVIEILTYARGMLTIREAIRTRIAILRRETPRLEEGDIFYSACGLALKLYEGLLGYEREEVVFSEIEEVVQKEWVASFLE